MNNVFYVRSGNSVTLVINGKTWVLSESSPVSANAVMQLVINDQIDQAVDLLEGRLSTKVVTGIAKQTPEQIIDQVLEVGRPGWTKNEQTGLLMFQGIEVPQGVEETFDEYFQSGHDLTALERFVQNINENPSLSARRDAYRWVVANNLTIDQDGMIVAYKRVNNDMTSFYDSNTKHHIGQWLSMPRESCDTDGNRTCSTGLHFCSKTYLPSYHGGEGRVIMVLVNPKDITAIPTDYNNAKGRACRYFVHSVLSDSEQSVVEQAVDVLPAFSVDTTTSKINTVANNAASNGYVAGYSDGYRCGRAKKAELAFFAPRTPTDRLYVEDYTKGFADGKADGRARAPKKYNAEKPAQVELTDEQLFQQLVLPVIARFDKPGSPTPTLNTYIATTYTYSTLIVGRYESYEVAIANALDLQSWSTRDWYVWRDVVATMRLKLKDQA